MSESRILLDDVEIILVGTGHILEKSVKEVGEVIEREHPDIVAVELCEGRYRALRGDVTNFSVKDALSGNPLILLTQWLLAYIQRKIGDEIGVQPGAEMLAAIEKAEERGCEVALVDRPIQITMQRFWAKMSMWEKLKMFFSLASAIFHLRELGEAKGRKRERESSERERARVFGGVDVEHLTDEDVVSQLLNELRQFSPGAATALLDERDAFIAGRLRSLSKMLHERAVREKAGKEQTRQTQMRDARVKGESGESGSSDESRSVGKIVAVVGAGHIQGIRKYLSNPDSIPPLEDLCEVAARKKISLKTLLTAGLLAVLLFLALAVIYSGISTQTLLTALFWWFLINGVLSGGGVIAARGHPLSALVAFSVAWLTSLNPFLAAGWFAGIVEASLRSPTVEDVKEMLKAESFGDLMQNRMFKVIFVAALANIGSMIGTFLGAYVVLRVVGLDIHHVFEGLSHFFSQFF
ncbi:MAG: TraB/GumN family protein [Candidatus Methanospirare jalkutatii]|nr:TraB/GumN family protein [Candidatus Methanospirare jalkutatii]